MIRVLVWIVLAFQLALLVLILPPVAIVVEALTLLSTAARRSARMQNRSGGSDRYDWEIPAYHEPLRTWAGSGTGATCNFCGSPIQAHEIEYEIELSPPLTGRTLRFHFRCHQAWEAQGRHGDQSENAV
jgi:hypothetical protein